MNSDPDCRYFTLEYHDRVKSALCEITVDGHSIWEVNDNLSENEFLEKIKSIVWE